MLEALIFDVDGTLIDSETTGHRVAYNRAFVESGLGWHWNEECYGKLLTISGGRERLRYYLQTRARRNERPSPGNTGQFIENLYQRKTRHFISIAESGQLLPRPGIYRIIVEARKVGMVLAIASSTDEKNVRALLRCSFDENIEHWFETIAAGETVDKKKSAPDIYRHVLRSLQLDSTQCLAFEDSAVGLRAAQAAGIPAIVTWNSYTRNDDFSGAALAIEHLDQLREIATSESARSNTALSGSPDLAALRLIHDSCLGRATSH